MPAKKEFNLIIIASYVLSALALLVVLHAGLLAALFSGLLVYSLVHMLAPALGKNIGALARVEPAAIAAEEYLDGALAFLQRDRMTLAIVGRIFLLRDLLRLIAAGQHRREAADRQQAKGRLAAASHDRRVKSCHRHVSAAQSRMNPYLPW